MDTLLYLDFLELTDKLVQKRTYRSWRI